jgi:hypothetical protein
LFTQLQPYFEHVFLGVCFFEWVHCFEIRVFVQTPYKLIFETNTRKDWQWQISKIYGNFVHFLRTEDRCRVSDLQWSFLFLCFQSPLQIIPFLLFLLHQRFLSNSIDDSILTDPVNVGFVLWLMFDLFVYSLFFGCNAIMFLQLGGCVLRREGSLSSEQLLRGSDFLFAAIQRGSSFSCSIYVHI